MTTLAAGREVSARKAKSDGGAAPGTLSVKLHTDVVESARIVAAFRNDSITDLVSNILRPVLARMEREEIAKRSKRTEGGDK